MARNISSLYFRYEPVAAHLPDCPHAGTDMWEATRFTWRGFDGEVRDDTLRLACHACGAVAFMAADREMPEVERTSASEIGYASRPERVAGLWLHPGPRIWRGDDRGPTSYYVTVARDRPRVPGDVAGVVGWQLGPRGGVRWAAGLGLTGTGRAREPAGQDWPSRRAAVAWIAARIAEVPS